MQELMLKVDVMECYFLKDCIIELIGKKTLKHFTIDGDGIIDLDIGDTTYNIEIIDVSNFTTMWPKFCRTIRKSLELRRLRL